MFPVGSLTKQQVRQIAIDVGMTEIAEKAEVSFFFYFFFATRWKYMIGFAPTALNENSYPAFKIDFLEHGTLLHWKKKAFRLFYQ